MVDGVKHLHHGFIVTELTPWGDSAHGDRTGRLDGHDSHHDFFARESTPLSAFQIYPNALRVCSNNVSARDMSPLI